MNPENKIGVRIFIIFLTIVRRILVTFVLLLPFVFIPLLYHNSSEEITIDIDFTERVNYENTGKYLIFTESETFQNTDSIIFLKFNSSDIYRDLNKNKGSEIDVVVAGWRIPFFSMYRNIIETK